MKRFLALILCIVMLIGTVPLSALATDGEPVPEPTSTPAPTEQPEGEGEGEPTPTPAPTAQPEGEGEGEPTPTPAPSEQPEGEDEDEPTPTPAPTEQPEGEGEGEPTPSPAPSEEPEPQPEALSQQSVADALAADGAYTLTEKLTLSGDFQLQGGTLTVQAGLVIPAGITMTVDGSLVLEAGASVVIESGAVLTGSESGSIRVDGGSLSCAEGGSFSVAACSVLPQSAALSGVDTTVFDAVYVDIATEEALAAALAAAAAFKSVHIYVTAPIALTAPLTVPANATVQIASGAGITATEEAPLVNNGNIRLANGSELSGPISGEGQVHYPMSNPAPQQTSIAADIAAALAADGYYELEGENTLDADLSIPAGTGVKVYGSLTVPDGVTLTVKGTLDIDSTGTVTIEAGGRLVHEDSSTGGGVQVYGILYVSEVPGSYSTTSYISLGNTGSIGGVAYEDIYCTHFIYNEAELLSALNAAWGMNNLVISDDVVITQDVVLHEHSFLNVVEGSTLTVAEGARLENNTGIWIGTGAYLIVNGTIANNGDIEEMEEGSLIINGTEEDTSRYTQEEFVAWMEENRNSDTLPTLSRNVTITSDLTIPGDVAFALGDGITFKVESGVRLTVQGQIYMWGNATFLAAGGSWVINGGYMSFEAGTVTFEDGAILAGERIHVTPDVTLSSNLYPYAHMSVHLFDDDGMQELQDAFTLLDDFPQVSVHFFRDFSITGDLTVPVGVHLQVSGDWGESGFVPNSVTIKNGATLTNYGSIDVASGCTLVIEEGAVLDNADGTITKGYDNSGTIVGTITGPGISEDITVDYAETLEEMLDILEGSSYVALIGSAALTEDLTIDEGSYLMIMEGASLTVPAGVMLTVDGSIHVFDGGSLKISKNGILQNNSYVGNEGSITVADGGKYKGDGQLQMLYGSTVKGVSKSLITAAYSANSEAAIHKALDITGYAGVDIMLEMADVTLSKNLTIPEAYALNITEGSALTIPEGVTLANEGYLYVYENASLIVLEGGMLANYGSFALASSGTYINNGRELDEGSNEVSVLRESELKAALAQAENYQNLRIYMGRSFSISDEVTIPQNVGLELCGHTLTVRSGAVLTNEGDIYGLPGRIDIREGGELINSSSIFDADLIANGTYTDNDGFLQFRLDNVRTNIPGEYIRFYDDYRSLSELISALAYLEEQEYYNAQLNSFILGEVSTNEELYIPANTVVTIGMCGEVIRLTSGGGITNQGTLRIAGPGKLIVEEGAYLRNGEGGYMDIDQTALEMLGEFQRGDSCDYHAYPRTQAELIAALNGDEVSIYINESITLSKSITIPELASLYIDYGGVLTVKSGYTLTNNGYIHVGDYGSVKISGKYLGNPMIRSEQSAVTAPEGSYATQGRLVESIVVDDIPAVTQQTLQLSATVYPHDAEYAAVEWSLISGNATVSPTGELYASEPGSVTVRATSTDGSGVYAEKTLELQNYGIALTCNGQAIDPDTSLQLISGEKIVLDAALVPGNLSNTKLVWEIIPGWEEYLSLSQKGSTATITAKYTSVVAFGNVKVRSADGLATSQDLSFIISPAAEKVLVSTSSGESGSVLYDLNAPANRDAGLTLSLYTEVLPYNASNSVIWSSSNKKVADVDASGRVTFTGTAGSVKITAAAAEDSSVKGSITINAKKLTQSFEIRGENRLMGGKSTTLTVWDTSGEEPVKLKSSQVTWSIEDSFLPVSISSSGKLSTKSTNYEISFHVVCRLKDNEDITASFPVTVYPAAQTVGIYLDTLPEAVYMWDEDYGIYYLDVRRMTEADRSITALAADVYPYGNTATLDWSSSSKNITIDVDQESGSAMISAAWDSKKNMPKTGTYTITAKATDGSGVKSSVKLCIGIFTDGFAEDLGDVRVTSGTTVSLCNKGISYHNGERITPTNPTITWELKNPADKAYVTLTSSGKLTAKTVYTSHEVELRARAKDTGLEVSCVTACIMPSALEKLAIVEDMEQRLPLTGTTRILPLGSTLQIYASRLTDTDGDPVDVIQTEGITFKSSSPSIASIDSTGLITANKAGTATITVTDANKKTATMKVKVEVPASTLAIADSKGNLLVSAEGQPLTDIYLAAGKSISFKALVGPGNATTKTATWTLVADSVGTLKGSKYTAPTTITFHETASILVKVGDLEQRINIKVYPATKSIQLLHALPMVNGVPQVDIRQMTQISFSAVVTPAFSEDIPLSWSSSNEKIATVTDYGEVFFTGNATGKVKITAKATDGTGKSASVTINAVCSPGYANPNYETVHIAGGRKTTLKLVSFYPEVTSLKSVTWKLDCESAYASISSKGVLTTKAVTHTESIVAYAYNVYGDPIAGVNINIYPATKSIKILHDYVPVKKDTIQIDLRHINYLSLSTDVTPTEASPHIDWISSKESVATVDEWGNVQLLKPGTVTITAKATDGTGKKASLKIVVVQSPGSAELNYGGATTLTHGQSITFKVSAFHPATATQKTVKWVLDPQDADLATLSSKGVLKATNGSRSGAVWVVAYNAATNEELARCEVTLLPEP